MAIKEIKWDVEGIERFDYEWEDAEVYNKDGYGFLKDYEVQFLEMKKQKHRRNHANAGRVVREDFNLDILKPPNARL